MNDAICVMEAVCDEVSVKTAEAGRGWERRLSRRELGALVEQFAPLVRALARRYEGRGAARRTRTFDRRPTSHW